MALAKDASRRMPRPCGHTCALKRFFPHLPPSSSITLSLYLNPSRSSPFLNRTLYHPFFFLIYVYCTNRPFCTRVLCLVPSPRHVRSFNASRAAVNIRRDFITLFYSRICYFIAIVTSFPSPFFLSLAPSLSVDNKKEKKKAPDFGRAWHPCLVSIQYTHENVLPPYFPELILSLQIPTCLDPVHLSPRFHTHAQSL